MDGIKKEIEEHKFQWIRFLIIGIFLAGIFYQQWHYQTKIVEENRERISTMNTRIQDLDKRLSDMKAVKKQLQKINEQAKKNGKRIYELRKEVNGG